MRLGNGKAIKRSYEPIFYVVRERDHANRLPNAKANAGCYTTVKTLDSVLSVDVPERVEDGQFRRTATIGSSIFRHGLHLRRPVS